ncbi:LIM domain protein [Paecilomyces variotii No. 5]|uniref:LIM domain protein n=1 Tax=Byssochlamys spectabilis (strain No. 5 / NBRC 109023) TaxID=1356009 RepID=V5GBG2_BYSSN|nr:LIM domain protein [Paecilomyces variotii No. 5]
MDPASYLKDLRSNRPPRPNGSRPLPSKPNPSSTSVRDELPPRAASALSMSRRTETPSQEHLKSDSQPRSASALSHRRLTSEAGARRNSVGRPLVQEPGSYSVRHSYAPGAKLGSPTSVTPSSTYRENGQRWMEKQEARSLRDALEELDLQEEMRIYAAAQDEATDLVWNHQHPGVPIKNPHAAYRNPDVTRVHPQDRSSYARAHSNSIPTDDESYSSKSAGAASIDSKGSASKGDTLPRKPKVNFALPPEEESPLPNRRDSGGSPKGIFRNPEDHIYEEPDERDSRRPSRYETMHTTSSALKAKPRNSLPRDSRPSFSRYDIHKNPPSQSSNPAYTVNSSPSPPPEVLKEDVPKKNGVEIRGDDIRAATSMKLKDRSSKLPMPTAVSDRLGRPIVSFDPTWKAPDEPRGSNSSLGKGKPSAAPAPPVPEISISESASIPTITLPDNSPPKISEMQPVSESRRDSTRPLPIPKNTPHKTHVTKVSQGTTNRWYSPYTRAGVPTATCAACTLPIAGKIVTAAGSRFHPECFTCHHCGTALECVAFYQEPEAKRAERLEKSAADDDEAQAMRFYCHLDFHELFSPRCKSCKTPIEGEVVVACGAEWHVGHFFCAECGDPFNSDTPFVEKDGFAWCLRCHSRRTASRCVGCKQPVLDDVVVTALGGQWHDKCFVCHECGSGFGPEGRFFVKHGEPKRTAKGRIIGGPVQLAVCERCEASLLI